MSFRALLVFPYVLVGAAGCSGALLLPDPAEQGGGPCSSDAECPSGQACSSGACYGNGGDCWSFDPSGRCPPGETCSGGVCVADGSSWCQCTPTQGCSAGVCVDIDEDNRCSPERPQGLCAQGWICVVGTCVPIDGSNACSQQHPSGLCPAGASCVAGTCVPIDGSNACSQQHPSGLCPAGQYCSAGSCVDAPCGPVAPSGACPAAYACRDGTCERLPCSNQVPDGLCGANEYCSSLGACIPVGSCDSADDCDSGLTCSVTHACIPVGTCQADEDCGRYHECSGGACVRDYDCAADGDCPSAEHCLGTGQCVPLGTCAATTDCPLGQFCSTGSACIPVGSCAVDEDCGAGDFCSDALVCTPDGTCVVTADCPPAHACDAGSCVPSGETCSANLVTTGCGGGEIECCPTGNPADCCAPGKRCSVGIGRCVESGECLADADCLQPHYACQDGACVPVTSCTDGSQCGLDEECGVLGACIPTNRCVDHGDCASGEACNGNFECVPGSNCGADQFDATLVEPNVLFVLDRSGSMNECVSGDDTSTRKWPYAVSAIDRIVQDHAGKIRFGLTTYPEFCEEDMEACSSSCSSSCTNSYSCTINGSSYGNCSAGIVDIVVGDDQGTGDLRQLFADTLAANFPGGNTPTGKALRAVAADRFGHGLPSVSDTVVRGNYIVLVTDGDANCDGTQVTGCTYDDVRDNSSDRVSRCKVNLALQALRDLSPAIETFVVGFNFTSVNRALNCHAVYGGRPRQVGACVGLDASSYTPARCIYGTSSQRMQTTTACYYEASNADQLSAAFDEIAGQIASCTFALGRTPPDLDKLFVYLDYGAPTGRVLVPRNSGSNGYWAYDGGAGQITFVGQVCNDVQAADATPFIVYGCADSGG